MPSGSPRWSPTISERVGTKNTSLSVTAAASDNATVSAESTVHSNTASINSTYETISFAPFVRTPPAPRPSQLWTHRADGTLSTDGVHCLDWTTFGLHARATPCNPAKYPHQVWNLNKDGNLVSGGAGSLVLDWTSRVGVDGGHGVYMHEASASLPHQHWAFSGKTLSSGGGDGLCLDSNSGASMAVGYSDPVPRPVMSSSRRLRLPLRPDSRCMSHSRTLATNMITRTATLTASQSRSPK